MEEEAQTGSTKKAAHDAETEALIAQPHGREQLIKMEILDMIHSGESPFDILYHVALWLEKTSGERGYARYVEDQLRAVYGFALEHEKPLQDEIETVKARLERIQKAFESPDFTEEEHIRIGFAIDRHKKNIERLELMLRKAQANHEKETFVKNEEDSRKEE